jgi:hypothetical protein
MNRYNLSCIFVLWIIAATISVQAMSAGSPMKQGESALLETSDGFVLFGMIQSATAESIELETVYGSLDIPFEKVKRINGDVFSQEHGLIHRHKLIIKSNGHSIHEYVYPLGAGPQKEQVHVLVQGTVLRVQDIDGMDLSFVSFSQGRFTRVQVTLPPRLLPSILMTVSQEDAVRFTDQSLEYSYRYVPAWSQQFQLQITMPEGYTLIEKDVPSQRLSDGIYVLEEAMQRQEHIVWDIVGIKN